MTKPLAGSALALILLGGLAIGGALLFKQSVHSPQIRQATKAIKVPQAQGARNYAQDPRAMRLADVISERQSLDRDWVRRSMAGARKIPQIQKLVLPLASAGNGKKKNWQAYRARFVEPVRVRAGLQFWSANAQALERAQQIYGVPASTIVGIIGMETLYGQQMGKIRVLDALATLALDFPKAHPRAADRQEYFVNELEQYLSTMYAAGSDPASLRGSYAGDMGLPQFMPTSWARYGVDFDEDGKTDLWSPSDAIGSVANYLLGHGWIAGLPSYYAIGKDRLRQPLPARWLDAGLAPSFSSAELQQDGLVLEGLDPQLEVQLAVVQLENAELAPTTIAATQNLRVITRYNPSRYYAMAVTELGNAIARERAAQSK